MSKEHAGTGYCDWAQALHLEKSTKLWLQTQSAVLLFFLIMYTFMMHKNGQIVTLCSISPSQSPRFRLSKPQKLQNSSHCVHLDTYTISWRYTHQKSQLLSQVQLDFPCSNLHGAKTITYIRNFHWKEFFFKKMAVISRISHTHTDRKRCMNTYLAEHKIILECVFFSLMQIKGEREKFSPCKQEWEFKQLIGPKFKFNGRPSLAFLLPSVLAIMFMAQTCEKATQSSENTDNAAWKTSLLGHRILLLEAQIWVDAEMCATEGSTLKFNLCDGEAQIRDVNEIQGRDVRAGCLSIRSQEDSLSVT